MPYHKEHAVMGEFKRGTLRSGSGAKVKKRKQAVAIALSEARRARGKSPPKRVAGPRCPREKKKEGETPDAERGQSHRDDIRGPGPGHVRPEAVPGDTGVAGPKDVQDRR